MQAHRTRASPMGKMPLEEGGLECWCWGYWVEVVVVVVVMLVLVLVLVINCRYELYPWCLCWH